MTKIKAVLFDLDGVLVDAREWHYEALNRALGMFGFTIERDLHLTTLDGLPTREKMKFLSGQKSLPIGLHEPINRLKQKFTKVANVKPPSSRSDSSEKFVVATGFRG